MRPLKDFAQSPVTMSGVDVYPPDKRGYIVILTNDGMPIHLNAEMMVDQINKWKKEATNE